MGHIILNRLLHLAPVLLGVAVVAFLIMHLVPGDPAELMLGTHATPEAVTQLRVALGLDRPLPIQFLNWTGRALVGDFGRSLRSSLPVLSELAQAWKGTVILAAASMVISAGGGMALGVLAVRARSPWVERIIMAIATAGVSIPSFALGLLLIALLGVKFPIFPIAGMFSPRDTPSFTLLLWHLTLPAITLAARPMALVARLTRSSLLQALGEDYVRTARAKGVSEGAIVWIHALRNALLPVVTVIAVQAGHLISETVLVETVFAWPGIGTLLLDAVASRDYPVVQGTLVFTAFVFVLVNLVADLLCVLLDPRIRYERD